MTDNPSHSLAEAHSPEDEFFVVEGAISELQVAPGKENLLQQFDRHYKGKAALTGAGGAVAFNISYFPDDRKFKALVKFGGCVGLGVSGKIGAEIGAGHLMEFAWWFRHQVVASMDSNLRYFQKKRVRSFLRDVYAGNRGRDRVG